MDYSFNIEYAKIHGIDCAILIKHLQFWITKNKANDRYEYDGRTWTYSSTKALTEIFPFWSTGQVNRIIRNLINKEIIITGNYNKAKYDRTKWYAFLDEQTFVDNNKCNSKNQKIDFKESKNAIKQNSKPIQDTISIYYKDCISIYNTFCINNFDAPAKIDGLQGKSMKEIIKYLIKVSKNKGLEDSQCVLSFEYILNNWHNLDTFTQKQVKLSQINSNIINIISQLKNEKRNSNSIAEEILSKYQ